MIRDRPTVYSNVSLTKCEDPRILEYFLQSQHPCAADQANPRDCVLFQASFFTNFVFLLTIFFCYLFSTPPRGHPRTPEILRTFYSDLKSIIRTCNDWRLMTGNNPGCGTNPIRF